MSDLRIAHKPALAGVKAGKFGIIGPKGPAVRMKAMPEHWLLHVLGAAGATDTERQLATLDIGAVRFAGPGQWLVVNDTAQPEEALARLQAALGNSAAFSDQTHGRVRIALEGPRAADVLSKGSAIDLDLGVFAVGRSGMTLMGHISVNLARTGPEAFELIVLRGFAESLWNDLIHMSLEYGLECIAAPETAAI